jgi:hypothetical protein
MLKYALAYAAPMLTYAARMLQVLSEQQVTIGERRRRYGS